MVKNTEEYQFKEEGEYIGETSEPIQTPEFEIPEKTRSFSPFKLPVKNKKTVIIVGIIVVIFLLMQVVKFFSSTPKQKIQERAPSAVETTPTPNLQSAGVNLLNEKFKSNESKILQMQNDMEDMKTTVTNMNKTVYDLNMMVQQLTAEVQKLIVEKKSLVETMKGKKTPYHIKAIVQGRAWLETNSGLNATVRVGTSLGKYGIVTEIDDQNGVVATDKGAKISYGANDL